MDQERPWERKERLASYRKFSKRDLLRVIKSLDVPWEKSAYREAIDIYNERFPNE